MTKRSTKALTEYLDALQAFGSGSNAARATQIGRMTAHRWTKQSRAAEKLGDTASPFWFFYAGEENFFHKHATEITKSTVEAILENALIRARDGTTKFTYFQGRRVPMLDYDLAELLGEPPEKCLLRDAQGQIVYETETIAPSNELSLAVLAAYNKRFSKRLSVDHNHAVSGGVMVAHSVGTVARPQIEQPRAALPSVEIIDEAVVAEVIADEIAAPAPSEETAPDSEQPDATPTPISSEMSDLRRDLLERAQAKGML